MGITERIADIEKEMARTQKNKGLRNVLTLGMDLDVLSTSPYF